MNILAISGSTRQLSTNTELLKYLAEIAPLDINVRLFDGLRDLPVFSPDLEGIHTPSLVLKFCDLIAKADGVVISSPEYVRTIPGGLKNAIDWMVSRDEIIYKPVALLHASHRGEDMLRDLRRVLHTITSKFDEENYLAFHLIQKSPMEIRDILNSDKNQSQLKEFLENFRIFIDGNTETSK
ncbi:MAG: NADPH-dependent FMN reductase [Rhizobiaceae bacterium]